MATILYIDTDEQYARYLCGHLKNAGHTCIYAKTGDTVVSLIEKHGVELVIAEVMLPDICGFGITRRVRSHEVYYMLPVILLSAMAEEDEMKHGYAQGVDAYFPKPVDPRILNTCIAQKIAENATAAADDPLTGLASSKKIKACVHRAIMLRRDFALIYIEMNGVPNFTRMHGIEARDRAIHHMTRFLNKWTEYSEDDLFAAGHMGAGHFMCLISQEKAKRFCSTLGEQWEKHLPRLNPSVENNLAGAGVDPAGQQTAPDLSLMICATGSGIVGAHSTNEYFDTLAQLRSKALTSGMAGIFLDHRRKF